MKIPMEQLSKMSLNQVNHQQTINKLTVSLNDGWSQRLQDSLQWRHYRLKIQDIEVSWGLFVLWQLLLRMQEANSWISTELRGQDEPFWLVYRKSGTQRACMSDIDSSVKKGYQKHQTTKSSNSVVLSCCPGVTQNCTFWILQDQDLTHWPFKETIIKIKVSNNSSDCLSWQEAIENQQEGDVIYCYTRHLNSA